MKKIILPLLAVCIALVFSCQKDDSLSKSVVTPPSTNPLDSLPKDLGGVHKAVVLGADSSPYGYYIYTPSAYSSNGPMFPLLVFLHGGEQIGNSKNNPIALDIILAAGPPHLIHIGAWAPEYPMIVASAQCHETSWDPIKVKQFIEFIMSSYQVDTLRVYLTGFSMGGYGTFDQLMSYGAGAHLAAAVSICGWGVALTAEKVKNASQVPLWVFHGELDLTVLPDFSKAIVKAINQLSPAVPAKITMYHGVGHDSWTQTYDGSGMGQADPDYDPCDRDIYSWMFLNSRK